MLKKDRPSHGLQSWALALDSGLDAPKAHGHSARLIEKIGRLAQRESTAFTRQGSLVQSQYRPPFSKIHLCENFNAVALCRTGHANRSPYPLHYQYIFDRLTSRPSARPGLMAQELRSGNSKSLDQVWR